MLRFPVSIKKKICERAIRGGAAAAPPLADDYSGTAAEIMLERPRPATRSTSNLARRPPAASRSVGDRSVAWPGKGSSSFGQPRRHSDVRATDFDSGIVRRFVRMRR